jgi:transcriptional regulator with GAF, ATPase, and Fis domain
VHCAAFPEQLLESELFGHARGAFTGAAAAREGRFEAAHGGTLLLDEIGEVPLSVQVKLLRVLQEREIERLGENQTRKVDVRIIAATHRDLPAMVRNGEFRADLYYRLRVLPLHVPALRERREDIPLLVHALLANMRGRHQGRDVQVSAEALDALCAHDWPGNVRELANALEYALVHADGTTVLPHHLPPEVRESARDRRLTGGGPRMASASLVQSLLSRPRRTGGPGTGNPVARASGKRRQPRRGREKTGHVAHDAVEKAQAIWPRRRGGVTSTGNLFALLTA